MVNNKSDVCGKFILRSRRDNMPRTARKLSKIGVYHVMVRGINRQDIFLDDKDRKTFLDKLNNAKERSNCRIYAYCLMSNHVHLLIAEEDETISQMMKRLGSSYVYWYNKRYERVGHLFQDRFRSEPINNESYLLTAIRYIHQNPVKAMIVSDCENYVWSSYRDYIKADKSIKGLTDTELCLELVGGIKQFAEFHKEQSSDSLIDVEYVEKASDTHAEHMIQQIMECNTNSEVLKMSIAERNEVIRKLKALPGVSNRQIAHITGINRNIIQRA